jgi:hypothetical protein
MITPAPILIFLLVILSVNLGLIVLMRTAFPSQKGRALGLICLWVFGTGAVPFVFVELGIGLQVQFPLFAIFLAISIGVGFSQVGYQLVAYHGLAIVAAFQVFRAPLEYVLVVWYDAGFMPVQMTWLGDNLDVVTGLLALPAAWLIWRGFYPRLVAALFNLIGIFFLCRIILIVGLSSPTPIRAIFGGYETGPDVMVGMSFPGVWIGTIAVAGAFFLHAASLGYLIRTQAKRVSAT